jgi:DNA-binding response OmpR family regulator
MTTILIVDDNPDLVELFSLVLTHQGYSTLTASGGEACIEILKTFIPDLILLDIMMEPLDGWETLKKLKYDVLTKPVPIIMLTGKPPSWEEVVAHMDDIEDYVIKPVTMQGLSDLVRGFFNRQDAITNECSIAKTKGADGAILDEYRQIRRSLIAGKTMLNVLGQPKESIERVLRVREKRLLVLQHQYRIPHIVS